MRRTGSDGRAGGDRPGRRGSTVARTVLWWAALFGLWLILISSVEPLEMWVGAAAALLAAVAAVAAGRAVARQ